MFLGPLAKQTGGHAHAEDMAVKGFDKQLDLVEIETLLEKQGGVVVAPPNRGWICGACECPATPAQMAWGGLSNGSI